MTVWRGDEEFGPSLEWICESGTNGVHSPEREYPQSIPRNFIADIFQREEWRKLSLWLLLSEDTFSYFPFSSSVLQK